MWEEIDPSDYSWESFIHTEEEEIGMFSYMSFGGMWTAFEQHSILIQFVLLFIVSVFHIFFRLKMLPFVVHHHLKTDDIELWFNWKTIA